MLFLCQARFTLIAAREYPLLTPVFVSQNNTEKFVRLAAIIDNELPKQGLFRTVYL